MMKSLSVGGQHELFIMSRITKAYDDSQLFLLQ